MLLYLAYIARGMGEDPLSDDSNCPPHTMVTDPEGECLCIKCGLVISSTVTDDDDEEEEESQPQLLPHNNGHNGHVDAGSIAIPKDGYIIPTARRHADYTLAGSLSGRISMANVDAHGNSVKNLSDIKNLRRADRYYANTFYNADKSVRSAIWMIISLCEKLGIGETVKERAAGLYRRAFMAGAVRGRSTRYIATACLFYASKEAGFTFPSEDFVRALEEPISDKKGKKNLFASYKVLTKVLDLPLPQPVSPLAELSRFAKAAGLSGLAERKAAQLYVKIQSVEKTVFCGKNPGAIAICLLWIASKYSMEKKAGDKLIGNAGRISLVTLRKRTEEYIRHLQTLGEPIPDGLIRQKPDWPMTLARLRKRLSTNNAPIIEAGEFQIDANMSGGYVTAQQLLVPLH